jgi:hypothetical protein
MFSHLLVDWRVESRRFDPVHIKQGGAWLVDHQHGRAFAASRAPDTSALSTSAQS